jgi:alkyl sulfatase BDS1-like metallo-beta-lactamase superfamily hydrolase
MTMSTDRYPTLISLLAAGLLLAGAAGAQEHFHPKGKPPSTTTVEHNRAAKATLPLTDRKDFEEQSRGFIARPASGKIMADAGHVAWDVDRFAFLTEQASYDSLHPSLQRQSVLNSNFGLYEVVPGIYQVRGFDLANISFIRSDNGWIVFDPLTSRETARAAKALVDEHLGEHPVVAVVYSHSHGDHWAGVRGVVDQADVDAGRVPIIAPRDFMEHTVSENVYAGNAMSRRLFYQYGVLLPASPFGYAGQGLGQGVASGDITLIPPTRIIEEDIEVLVVDGVKMEFQNTPNTEAPSEMNTWFPDLKVLWMAENATGTMHNIYTLRGAPVRDALRWSKYLNEALWRYGREAQVMFASHHWPRWGNERIQAVLRGQRDLYANLNNQVLHYANQGVTINEIHNVYELPESIELQWYNRGYHGSAQHNSRAVINRYLGYWDANPATLVPLSPDESAPLYVEMMGGAGPIMAKGRELFDEGRYLHAQEIVNRLVLAQPDNQSAKDLLADIFEQLGYQAENPGIRNSYLAAAFELRSGIPEGVPPSTVTPDVIRAMSTELLLDFVAIRLDSRKAADMAFTINLITPDRDEQFVVELSGATLTNIEGYQDAAADLTIRIDRTQLEPVFLGLVTLQAQVDAGKAGVEGDTGVFDQLLSTLVDFDPTFEIMPGTKAGD